MNFKITKWSDDLHNQLVYKAGQTYVLKMMCHWRCRMIGTTECDVFKRDDINKQGFSLLLTEHNLHLYKAGTKLLFNENVLDCNGGRIEAGSVGSTINRYKGALIIKIGEKYYYFNINNLVNYRISPEIKEEEEEYTATVIIKIHKTYTKKAGSFNEFLDKIESDVIKEHGKNCTIEVENIREVGINQ